MGGDGGSIPGRTDLVRTKKKSEKVDRAVNLAARWKHCAISQEPLRQPIVACQLGRLYNKDKLIEYLLDKSKFENVDCGHIRTLKDVKELNLTLNQAADHQNAKGDAFNDLARSEFACPISGLEMNGRFGFIFLWGCGCVFSDRALKEVKLEVCTKCHKPMRAGDIVIINGSEDEVAQMEINMKERAAATKKSKKRRKEESTQESTEATTSKLSRQENGSSSSTQHEQNDSKLAENGHSSSSHQEESLKKYSKATEEKKKYKTIQKDPNASQALKSLFTTSSAARNQPKNHWVTHNPQYY